MGIVTFEGVVEQGQIKLKSNVRLPENARVFVVVPDVQVEQVAHVFTPRLARREDAADFEMEVSRE
jgi:hypothetical protein